MVRKYKRKNARSKINETKITKAVTEIICNIHTISSASRKYKIPYRTLSARLKKITDAEFKTDKHDGPAKNGAKQVFTMEEEAQLAEFINTFSLMKHGLTCRAARKFVFDYATVNDIQHPASWNTMRTAGRDWLEGFKKRNPHVIFSNPDTVIKFEVTI